jgi:hypothetical protein
MVRETWAVVWGATWGNNMAAVEWSVIVGAGAWLLRHRIGRGLAAWWAGHYREHAIKHHREALRDQAE